MEHPGLELVVKQQTFMGQTVLELTELFGKWYFWMRDGDGVVYLLKDTDGVPDFSGLAE